MRVCGSQLIHSVTTTPNTRSRTSSTPRGRPAREFQPQGVHVAHVIIDGQIASDRPGRSIAERGLDAVLDPNAIAESYYQLHLQPPSAWTLELDLRPYVEKF
ncbi:MAG: hypothetical protein A3F74_22415 [Betaproteobacteria bacterium RIFCSPLOWO2_12_FULL_62_58]|nr:MAG: hypothetical protein A3F74_22415 [Betaproteobacteria bacterium RIFCSPLOWO2_12_FULL_62_58]